MQRETARNAVSTSGRFSVIGVPPVETAFLAVSRFTVIGSALSVMGEGAAWEVTKNALRFQKQNYYQADVYHATRCIALFECLRVECNGTHF